MIMNKTLLILQIVLCVSISITSARAQEVGSWRYFENVDLAQLQKDINNGWDVTKGLKGGRYPIQSAVAICPDLGVIQLLVSNGADLSFRSKPGGDTALHSACGYNPNAIQVARFLIDQGADLEAKDDYEKTPLFEAVARGDLDLIKFLVDAGAATSVISSDGSNLLHSAAESFTPPKELYTYLINLDINADLRNKYGSTPLNEACQKGIPLDAIRVLVESGVDVNNYGMGTPLHLLSTTEHATESVDYLVSKGAKIDIVDEQGKQPIHWAAGSGELDMIKKMIALGASPVAQSKNGTTPLHEAAESNPSPDVIRYLVSQGADINASTKYKYTPLSLAANSNENAEVVETILDLGGDPNAIDALYETVFKKALSNKNLEGSPVLRRLREAQTTKNHLQKYPNELLDPNFLEPLDWSSLSEFSDIIENLQDYVGEQVESRTFIKEDRVTLLGHETIFNFQRSEDGAAYYKFHLMLVGYGFGDVPKIIDYFTQKLGEPDAVQGYANKRKSADWLIGSSHVKVYSTFAQIGDNFMGMPCIITVGKAGESTLIGETIVLNLTGKLNMLDRSGRAIPGVKKIEFKPFVLALDLEDGVVYDESLTDKLFKITKSETNSIEAAGLGHIDGSRLTINRATGTFTLLKSPDTNDGTRIIYEGNCTKLSNAQRKF